MKNIWNTLNRLRKKAVLTPEQAKLLAHLKFPCC